MWPMIQDDDSADLNCNCHVGERYFSHRYHFEMAQERTRLEVAAASVESELA